MYIRVLAYIVLCSCMLTYMVCGSITHTVQQNCLASKDCQITFNFPLLYCILVLRMGNNRNIQDTPMIDFFVPNVELAVIQDLEMSTWTNTRACQGSPPARCILSCD